MTYRVSKLSGWKRHKYHARAGRCQKGHPHRSGLEVRVCDELRLREIAGEITGYEVEVPIDLVGPSGHGLGQKIIVDFHAWCADGTREFIEAKGMVLQPWPLKWALLQDLFRDNPLVKFRVVKR